MSITQLALPFDSAASNEEEGQMASITDGMTINTVPIKYSWAQRKGVPAPLRNFYETLAHYKDVQPNGKYDHLTGLVQLYMELVAESIAKHGRVEMPTISFKVRGLLPGKGQRKYKINNVVNTGMARLLLKMVPAWEDYIKVNMSRIFARDPDLAIDGVDVNRKDGKA